jgi:hypothetical protein
MIMGLLYVEVGRASSTENGAISTSTTWTSAGSPYTLTGNVIINSDATLTIQPGVTVDFGNYQIQVEGVLSAQGTSSNRIVFSGNSYSSAAIDFMSSNSGSTIQNANFYSVQVSVQSGSPAIIGNYFASNPISVITVNTFNNGSPLISDNTINILYSDGIDVNSGSATISSNFIAGQDGYYGVYVASSASAYIFNNNIIGCYSGILTDGSSSIEGNNVMNNLHDGVCSNNSTSTIENNAIAGNLCGVSGVGDIKNNTITNNQAGIWGPSSAGTIVYNNIFSNYNTTSTPSYVQNIHLTNSNNITAIDNWWGSTDVPTINQTIWDYKNATNLGTVLFVPFLNASNPFAPSIPASIPVPTPPPTPAPFTTPTPSPNQTLTPSPTPHIGSTPSSTPLRTPSQPKQVTPSPIIGYFSTSTMDSIIVIAVAFVLAATIIVAINRKFGRRNITKSKKRRKPKRKSTEQNSS